jgi:hypothetical protein
MSNRYIRLLDLLRRPEGCSVVEASQTLGVTAAGCRGMIRDLRAVVRVESVYEAPGGRGKGRRAIHFVRHAQAC